MMAMYGRAVIEERMKPRRFAEIAAYVRQEYGSGVGPEFLFVQAASGAAARQRRPREAGFVGMFRTLAKAVKALVPGTGNARRGRAQTATR
ncbi:MAG TPA: hypothetical protein VEM95_03375 [Thermoplasmata archaeon]|nr:hypothetical protein [Thermoplasmata archaeon]